MGASGSGKTSLLGAGVAPAVARGGVSGVSSTRMLSPGPEPSARQADGSDDELLVVDQFEELFTQCRDPELRGAFIERVLARTGATVIGLRADFYAEVSAHPELASRVAGNQLLLGPMPEEELRRAVCEPARRAGLRLEAGLVDRVVRDARVSPARFR